MTQPPVTGAHDFGITIPDRIHPQADAIGERLAEWAERTGLAASAAEQARLRGAGFHQVAARILPDERQEDVELFAQWVVWLLHLDDEQDEGALGHSPQAVHATYTAITAVIKNGPATVAAPPGAAPAVRALADLWPRTAASMSPAWNRRILGHIHRHRDAFLTQITHRTAGTIPTPDAYPALRRDANGMFGYDIVEVACRTEIPPSLAAGTAWTELCAASSDVTAWCNDVYSLAREQANNEPTNYVTVLQHALNCPQQEAVQHVRRLITRRLHDLDQAQHAVLTAARQVPGTASDSLARVVRIIRDMPGPHLGWMLASGPYSGQP